jgi:hypothetical protein
MLLTLRPSVDPYLLRGFFKEIMKNLEWYPFYTLSDLPTDRFMMIKWKCDKELIILSYSEVNKCFYIYYPWSCASLPECIEAGICLDFRNMQFHKAITFFMPLPFYLDNPPILRKELP